VRHVTIPSGWSAEEALAVVSFLEEVIRAVWRAHGARMSAVLCKVEVEPWCETAPAAAEDPFDEAPPF